MKKILFSLLLAGISLSASAQAKFTTGTPCETAKALTTIIQYQLKSGSNFRMTDYFPDAPKSRIEDNLIQWLFGREYGSKDAANAAQTSLIKQLSVCLGVAEKSDILSNHYTWQQEEVEITCMVADNLLALIFRKGNTRKEVDKEVEKNTQDRLDYIPPARK